MLWDKFDDLVHTGYLLYSTSIDMESTGAVNEQRISQTVTGSCLWLMWNDVRSVAACSWDSLMPGVSTLAEGCCCTLLVAHWTSSKAEHPRTPQSWAQHPGDAVTACAQCAMDEVWLSTALCVGLTQCTNTSSQGSFPLLSWDRRWLVKAQTHTHTESWIPWVPAPLAFFSCMTGHAVTLSLCNSCVEAQQPVLADSST